MALSNGAIADALEELGDLYELDGAIVHRVLAYRTAAKRVREASVSVGALALEGRATALNGIGKTLQEKIQALTETGAIPAAEKLRAKYPPGLIEIMRLPGIGAKRTRLLYDELGIDSPTALREAALAQHVRSVRGLGAKFEERVLQELERAEAEPGNSGRTRLVLPQALELGEALVRGLSERAQAQAQAGERRDDATGRAGKGKQRNGDTGTGTSADAQTRRAQPRGPVVMIAGSARRMADSVKDIDLIAVTTRPVTLAKSLAKLPEVESVQSASASGARGRLHVGVGVDLRIGKPDQLGNLLQHFTGSGAHNAALREGAVREGLHVSEHGVLDDRARRPDDGAGKPRTYASEEEVYGALGLAYIEPELRENRGELQAARAQWLAQRPDSQSPPSAKAEPFEVESSKTARSPAGGLPELIEQRDVRGDLHMHTVASDGHATIAEMAAAARDMGYEYIAITDHSASHGFGNHVSPEDLRAQIERVREVDAHMDGIRVLAGSEVNILPDGSLDYENELLAQLDWVLASVHTAFGIGERAMTERVVRAIEHPLVDAIGHPTGRLIERREPYEIDLPAVFAAAAKAGTLLEINANPDRRDLSDAHAREAVRAGAKIVIDSDAHRVRTLANMRWGIATARRAWITKEDVANTRPWAELAKLRKSAAHRR